MMSNKVFYFEMSPICTLLGWNWHISLSLRWFPLSIWQTWLDKGTGTTTTDQKKRALTKCCPDTTFASKIHPTRAGMFYSKGLGRGLIGRTKEGLEVALNSLLPPGPAPSNMSNLHHTRFTFSLGVKKVNVKKENVSKNKKVKVKEYWYGSGT